MLGNSERKVPRSKYSEGAAREGGPPALAQPLQLLDASALAHLCCPGEPFPIFSAGLAAIPLRPSSGISRLETQPTVRSEHLGLLVSLYFFLTCSVTDVSWLSSWPIYEHGGGRH